MKHKKIYKSLINMINWTEKFLETENVKIISRRLSFYQWAKEYCTIKFCLPRGSGHTHFAIKLCEEFMYPVIIVPSSHLKKIVLETAYPKVPKIFTMVNLRKPGFCTSFHDGIIIDNSSLLSEGEKAVIYQHFGQSRDGIPNPNRQFVFLE